MAHNRRNEARHHPTTHLSPAYGDRNPSPLRSPPHLPQSGRTIHEICWVPLSLLRRPIQENARPSFNGTTDPYRPRLQNAPCPRRESFNYTPGISEPPGDVPRSRFIYPKGYIHLLRHRRCQHSPWIGENPTQKGADRVEMLGLVRFANRSRPARSYQPIHSSIVPDR